MTGISALDLAKVGSLTFEEPRLDLFPCLDLARRALSQGHTVELNAANEVMVDRFLTGKARFTDIPRVVEEMLCRHAAAPLEDIEAVLALDREIRCKTAEYLENKL